MASSPVTPGGSSNNNSGNASDVKEPHEVVSLLKGDVVHGNAKGFWRPVPYRDHRFQLTLFEVRNLERQQPELLTTLQGMFPSIPVQGLRKILECINTLVKDTDKKFCDYTVHVLPEKPPGKFWKKPISTGWQIHFRLYYVKLQDQPNGINLWGHFHAIVLEDIPTRWKWAYNAWFHLGCLCCGYHKDTFYKRMFAKNQFSLMEKTEGQLTSTQEFTQVEFAEMEAV